MKIQRIRPLLGISRVTFHELIREKILWSSFVFGILIISLSFLISRLSFAENARIAMTFGLTSIGIIGGLISVVMGSALISKEINARTHFLVLTKPVSRWQYVLGRSFGLLGVLFVNVLIMSFIVAVIFLVSGGRLEKEFFTSLFLQFIEFGVITALATIFSVFSTSTLAAIFTSGFWVLGHAMEDIKILAEKIEPVFLRPILAFITWIIPDLTRFDVKAQVAHDIPVSGTYFLLTTGYGLLYIAFAYALACLIFSKREL